MKINEVETLAGITKKNIRFYEEQGLLNPKRNAENGYRDYSDEDVAILRRIRLLRKLGVPIEEIRAMFAGTHTVGDGMRRHLITLEREQRNLEQSAQLCRQMQNLEVNISSLDADAVLSQMEEMERGGIRFQDRTAGDVRTRYIAPVIVTAIIVCIMAALCGVILWAYFAAPDQAPPLWIIGIILAIFAAIGAGTVFALTQRIGEIRKGELDDAKYY